MAYPCPTPGASQMSEPACNFTMLNVALIVAIGGPWAVWIGAGALALVRMANNRRAFWVPLVAAPGVAIPLFVGAALAMAAT